MPKQEKAITAASFSLLPSLLNAIASASYWCCCSEVLALYKVKPCSGLRVKHNVYLRCMRIVFILFVTLGLAHSGAAQNDCSNYFSENPSNCCEDCTCRYCWTVGCCEDSPVYSEADCSWTGISGDCGVGGGTGACTDFAENNNNGGVCIPIDGGLGFLIAGGLGMGVVGIRRRKELELITE